MSNKITKQFRSVFILDASKLSRLLNIIEGRFADLGGAPIYTFRFLTKNEKTYLRNSVDEVLRHDNPVNNPIVELAIVCKDKEKEPENLCCVEYNRDHSYIDVDVTSLDAKKGAELFAEIEEQIERCMDKSLAYRVKLGGLFFILPLLMVFMMGVVIYSGLFGEGNVTRTYCR